MSPLLFRGPISRHTSAALLPSKTVIFFSFAISLTRCGVHFWRRRKERWTTIVARLPMWRCVINNHVATLPSKCPSLDLIFHHPSCSQLVFVHQHTTKWHNGPQLKGKHPQVVPAADGIDLENEGFPARKCKSEVRGCFHLWDSCEKLLRSVWEVCWCGQPFIICRRGFRNTDLIPPPPGLFGLL